MNERQRFELDRHSLKQEIRKKKALLNKYKEDVEQVELFGMYRDDYMEKRNACTDLILNLRELEKELSRMENK